MQVIEFKNTNPFLNYEEKQDTSESICSDDSDKMESKEIIINVEISNPDIEITTSPDCVKDASESIDKFTFSR